MLVNAACRRHVTHNIDVCDAFDCAELHLGAIKAGRTTFNILFDGVKCGGKHWLVLLGVSANEAGESTMTLIGVRNVTDHTDARCTSPAARSRRALRC